MIKEITPLEAWDILQADANAVVLDVRSTMEYLYVGHPPGALHVPLKEPPAWEVDPAFVEKVRRALREKFRDGPKPEDLTILALCRSGQRSMTAAELMTDSGFNSVCNILEGFEGERDGDKHRNTINGWRVRQLPWEQS
jgi:rhodanese-related sulfurtransferase